MNIVRNLVVGDGEGRLTKVVFQSNASRFSGLPREVVEDAHFVYDLDSWTTIKNKTSHQTPDAIKVLVGIMENDESDAARVSAAKELLDRAYGRAQQAVDVNQATHVTFSWLD